MIYRRLNTLIKERGYTNQNIWESLGFSQSSFYYKIKNQSFTIEELKQISTLLNLTFTELTSYLENGTLSVAVNESAAEYKKKDFEKTVLNNLYEMQGKLDKLLKDKQ